MKGTLRMRCRLSELDQANEFTGPARLLADQTVLTIYERRAFCGASATSTRFVREANSNRRLPILQGSLSKRGMQERSGSSSSAASRATPISPL